MRSNKFIGTVLTSTVLVVAQPSALNRNDRYGVREVSRVSELTDVDSQWNGGDEQTPDADGIQTAQAAGQATDGPENGGEKAGTTGSSAGGYHGRW